MSDDFRGAYCVKRLNIAAQYSRLSVLVSELNAITKITELRYPNRGLYMYVVIEI